VFFKAQLGVRMDVAAQAHEARHIGKTINQVHRGSLVCGSGLRLGVARRAATAILTRNAEAGATCATVLKP
jgi:hypothetical protein